MVDAHALGACGLGRAGSNSRLPHQIMIKSYGKRTRSTRTSGGSDYPIQATIPL